MTKFINSLTKIQENSRTFSPLIMPLNIHFPAPMYSLPCETNYDIKFLEHDCLFILASSVLSIDVRKNWIINTCKSSSLQLDLSKERYERVKRKYILFYLVVNNLLLTYGCLWK